MSCLIKEEPSDDLIPNIQSDPIHLNLETSQAKAHKYRSKYKHSKCKNQKLTQDNVINDLNLKIELINNKLQTAEEKCIFYSDQINKLRLDNESSMSQRILDHVKINSQGLELNEKNSFIRLLEQEIVNNTEVKKTLQNEIEHLKMNNQLLNDELSDVSLTARNEFEKLKRER